MDKSQQIASDITTYMKYAKYNETLKRRETFEEIVERNMQMHMNKYPHIADAIKEKYEKYVKTKKVLPSMRSLQFAGKPIAINNSRMFNCSYLPIDHIDSFSEIMFLLLGGTGVGYSVQRHHVDKLPELQMPKKRTRRYLAGDSIEGWADTIKVVIEAYFKGKADPVIDYSDIRPKGSLLVTSGGKAPGPEPLMVCVNNIRRLFNKKSSGDKLTPLECHDICCYIADAVLAGGIRRAALISLFSIDDTDMLECKFGNWWELNPQRGRANNSAVVLRHRVQKEDFFGLWKKVEASGSGEPGIFFTNDKDIGTNPCAEISLRPFQFCNLTTINVSDVESQEDFESRAAAAAFIGTLQAGYTDFHYLRDIWRRTTEKDALLGVSMTGIASGKIDKLDLEKAARIVKGVNKAVSLKIGINPAARTTCVKPEGTASLVLGSSSGVHAWHNDYYIRRIRVGKNEAIYDYLVSNHPELITDDLMNSKQGIIELPQRAPKGATTRSESPMDLLGRVKRIFNEWIKPGHRNGDNYHNVSCTVSIKDDEWEMVGEWMWKNRDSYTGLSVLPHSDHTYVQAPFEDISEDQFNEMFGKLSEVNLSQIKEEFDNTDLKMELACAGGACEVV